METESATRYVIIGTGPAGDEAARYLREGDPQAAITMITAGKLPFIRRYDLHKVFEGVSDWRELLVHPPHYFDDMRITLRRSTHVVSLDPQRRQVGLQHKESITYDKLLIASGGGGYLPEGLQPYRHLIQRFGSFEDAVQMRDLLPEQGEIVMIGGDMMGIDLARKLVGADYRVTLIAGEQLFWPHRIDPAQQPALIEALEKTGVEVVTDKKVSHIEQGQEGMHPRRVVCDDSSAFSGDVVLAFCGLAPTLGYLAAAELHIQRGLLVDTHLATVNERIWGAGDVCQIWIAEENRYRFSYEWQNVKEMGRVAACNMSGGDEMFTTESEDFLRLGSDGSLQSSFWNYG